MWSLFVLILLSFFLVSFTVWAYEIDQVAETTYIVDGDTFDIDTGERIRLADVDTPALYQEGGPEAEEYLTSLILGKTVYLDIDDKYETDYKGTGDRFVCIVYLRRARGQR
jgi:endonuclease YncB( thermonuclease family)